MSDINQEEKISVYIVEDESIVARDLAGCLTNYNYEVLGISNNGPDAVEKILELKPDIVLMDIMIKGTMSGLEVASIIKEKANIPVIFLTAYADEATLNKAKICEPYGYILKPFKEAEVHSTIKMAVFKHKRFSEIKKERDFLYSLAENLDPKSKDIFIRSYGKLMKIQKPDILFVEAMKDYVIIHTKFSRYTIHSTMKDIEQNLGPSEFIRVHRSFIVNLEKIETIEGNEIFIEGNKARAIPIGANYKEEVLKRIRTI
ncbi:MAG: LytTR family transcriptional regulator DNA-binding domain-containing protein [Bacteroidia bacterium]|nr:LytTR family transcriptional regulator DNA-binding domain-containing protein [Bacteroidia bacterium]